MEGIRALRVTNEGWRAATTLGRWRCQRIIVSLLAYGLSEPMRSRLLAVLQASRS